MKIAVEKRILKFKQPAGTSRGIYQTRTSWFVTMTDEACPGVRGVGECAPLPELSCDLTSDYEERLCSICRQFEQEGLPVLERVKDAPSILFGLETAHQQFLAGGQWAWTQTPFTRGEEGIRINGLVWMGDFDAMAQRLEEKIAQGFACIKIKVGAIDFDRELALIARLRNRFSARTVELRLDANGAFTVAQALDKLDRLSKFNIHSIEQPIRAGQWPAMAALCKQSPIPIALDEELIGVNATHQKVQLLNTIQPAYIILKPSLHGGMAGTKEWVTLANERHVGSWLTSALESNVGLNAIAQLATQLYPGNNRLPQGLGTGLLFENNVNSPLYMQGDKLWFDNRFGLPK